MLHKANGKTTLSKTCAYEWYSAFKSGRDVVEDLPRSGRPSTSPTEVNITKVKEMVTENRRLSLREIAAKLSVSDESIRTILNDCLRMKRVAARQDAKIYLTRLLLTNEFLAKNSTNIIEQPPHPLDMAPAEFFLFSKLKLPLRDTRFQSIGDTEENSQRKLKSIPENEVLMIRLFVSISELFREGATLKAIK